jgi:hypothetical protein
MQGAAAATSCIDDILSQLLGALRCLTVAGIDVGAFLGLHWSVRLLYFWA